MQKQETQKVLCIDWLKCGVLLVSQRERLGVYRFSSFKQMICFLIDIRQY